MVSGEISGKIGPNVSSQTAFKYPIYQINIVHLRPPCPEMQEANRRCPLALRIAVPDPLALPFATPSLLPLPPKESLPPQPVLPPKGSRLCAGQAPATFTSERITSAKQRPTCPVWCCSRFCGDMVPDAPVPMGAANCGSGVVVPEVSARQQSGARSGAGDAN